MHRVERITMIVSGIRECNKKTEGLAIKNHGKFTAQVPYINIHRVEVIEQVHWHTKVFTKKLEARQGKPSFKKRGKPKKKLESKQAKQHSFSEKKS
jgi:hypothetical protein